MKNAKKFFEEELPLFMELWSL